MVCKKVRLSICLMLLILVLGTGSDCFSDSSVKQISTPELKKLLEERTDALLINVLPPIIHDAKHLPGSINYPIGKMERQNQLPFPPNQPLIFYCMGVLWLYSPKAARLAQGMGYQDVMVYREGIIGWAKSGNRLESSANYPNLKIPLISAEELLASETDRFQIIDIRPGDHFNRGHVNASTHIDLEILHDQLDRLSTDKEIILVDHKGKLTLTTGRYLHSEGFSRVFRLDGGFNAWVKQGFPISKKE